MRDRPVPFELRVRDGDEIFPLSRRGAYLLLSEDGIHIGRRAYSQRSEFVPYEDLTHVVPARRGLWIGTRRTVYPLTRGRRTPLDLRAVAGAIEARIARRPGGAAQLARMREVDERMRAPHGRAVTVAVVALCVAIHALQIADGFTDEVGAFVPELVREGELWRVVTMHFLHEVGVPPVEALVRAFGPLSPVLPLHIAVNAALALLFAHLVEQPLGALRTAWVLGAAALGAAGLSALFPGQAVIGASGLVMGLAGAALALEVHHPEALPAPWRLPRKLFLGALVAEGVTGFALPFVAGWTHLGGFLGGYFACRLVARSGLCGGGSPALWLRPAAAAMALLVALSFARAAALLSRDVDAMNAHGRHLLALDAVNPGALNNLAWRIVTESLAGPGKADVARALALRAVDSTGHANPDYLDTLAEVLFLEGEREAALEVIDEAIALAPWEPYFRAQRERFAGLRPPGDRPDPPRLPWPFRPVPEPGDPWLDDGTGIGI